MDFNELKEQVTNAQDVSDMFTAEDIEQNKAIVLVSTIFPILFFLPVVVKPESGYGKFYANQILTYFVTSIVLNIVNAVLGAILGLIPLLGGILAALVGLAIVIVLLAIWLFLLVNAAQGKAKAIPIIGNLFKVFN